MKKIMAMSIAVLFICAGTAIAGDYYTPPAATASWNGTQSQGYSSYNFQGNTFSNTFTATHTNDNSFTVSSLNIGGSKNFGVDNTNTCSFSAGDTVTFGKLQQQGLSMGQTGSQVSSATPAFGVSGSLGWNPAINVLGAGGAGASGSQGQTVWAANAQGNGDFSLKIDKNSFNMDIFTADGSVDKSGFGIKGAVIGGAGSFSNDPAWLVAGYVAGYGYDHNTTYNDLSFKNIDIDNFDLSVKASFDYQSQDGGGAAYQNSNTCAGLGCYANN